MEKQVSARLRTILRKQIFKGGSPDQSIVTSIRNALSDSLAGGTGYIAVFGTSDSVRSSDHLYENTTGVGIGTIAPESDFHVSGKVLACSFALDCSPSPGQVMFAADASGNALWSDLPSGGGTIDGSGTAGRSAVWSDADTLRNGIVEDNEAVGWIYSNAIVSQALFCGFLDHGSAAKPVFHATNDGGDAGGSGYQATTNGGNAFVALPGLRRGYYAYRDLPGATEPLLDLFEDNASTTIATARIRGDGSGDLLQLKQGTTERWSFESGGILRGKSGSAFHLAGTGTTSPGIDVTSTTGSGGGANPDYILEKDGDYHFLQMAVGSSGHANHANSLIGFRARNTLASPQAVQADDQVFGLFARAYDGSNYQQRAYITTFIDGAVSAGNVPKRIVIATGVSSAVEAMRITSAQLVGVNETSPAARLDVKENHGTRAAISANQQGAGPMMEWLDNGTIVANFQDGGILNLSSAAIRYRRVAKSSNYTVVAADQCIEYESSSATGNVTFTLPATVVNGDWWLFTDVDYNCATTNRNMIIGRNGNTLNNGAANLTYSTNGAQVFVVGLDGKYFARLL